MDLKHKVIEKSNNCLKISVEYNAFDVNEDKQRQCYEQWKCFWPKCRYSANRKGNLNEHISHHLNNELFVCNQCNKQFRNISSLYNHIRYFHSNERHFVCQRIHCKKRFKTKFHLTRHQLTHSSVKSFGCNKCDKRFKSEDNLRSHKSFHSSVRPFVCPQTDCKHSFKTKEHLIQHNKTHSSERHFECNDCHKRFISKPILISHKLIHSNEKHFKCIP